MSSEDKRILWLTNNWLFDYGGRKIACIRILNHLAKKNFGIHVMDFEIKELRQDKIKDRIGLSPKIKFSTIFLPSNKGVFLENFKFARQKEFDFIVISGSAIVDILSIVAIKTLRLYPHAKLILFQHTNILSGIYLSNFWFIHILLAKLAYKTVECIITPSKSLGKMFLESFNVTKNKIKTIRYPIISKEIFKLMKQNVNEKIFRQKNIKLIITSARLNLEQKDYLTLFQAFKIVLQTQKNAVLAVLGEGPDKKKIYRLADNLNLRHQIIFLGFQKNPFKYIYNSDLFVLSSFFEGSPLVLVEAMACKVPVISSDCETGPRETIVNNKNGILFPVGDEKKLSDAIIMVLNNIKMSERLILNGLIKTKEYQEENSLKLWNNFLKKQSY